MWSVYGPRKSFRSFSRCQREGVASAENRPPAAAQQHEHQQGGNAEQSREDDRAGISPLKTALQISSDILLVCPMMLPPSIKVISAGRAGSHHKHTHLLDPHHRRRTKV